jgi:hypothetical protein
LRPIISRGCVFSELLLYKQFPLFIFLTELHF